VLQRYIRPDLCSNESPRLLQWRPSDLLQFRQRVFLSRSPSWAFPIAFTTPRVRVDDRSSADAATADVDPRFPQCDKGVGRAL